MAIICHFALSCLCQKSTELRFFIPLFLREKKNVLPGTIVLYIFKKKAGENVLCIYRMMPVNAWGRKQLVRILTKMLVVIIPGWLDYK